MEIKKNNEVQNGFKVEIIQIISRKQDTRDKLLKKTSNPICL